MFKVKNQFHIPARICIDKVKNKFSTHSTLLQKSVAYRKVCLQTPPKKMELLKQKCLLVAYICAKTVLGGMLF